MLLLYLQPLDKEKQGFDHLLPLIFLCAPLPLSPTSKCEPCLSVHSLFCCRKAKSADREVHKVKRLERKGKHLMKEAISIL